MPNTAEKDGTTQTVKKAFITAPPGLDIHFLRNTLRRRGIESFFADEVGLPGSSLPEILTEGLDEADLVIGFLDAERNNGNVLFELGFAMALGKRVLVFTPNEEIFPGVLLTGMQTVRATPHDEERIEFGLTQAIAAPRKKEKTRKEPVKQTHPIGELAEQLLAEIPPGTDPRRVEEVIAKAIKQSGVTTLSATKDAGILAVWSDDLEPWVGNPLLVEIKTGRCNGDLLEKGVEQVRRGIEARGASWGLFIHSGLLPPGLKKRLRGTSVLAISVEDFLRSMKDEAFADLVRGLRNDRVHGRG
jgi:hypothetical protein